MDGKAVVEEWETQWIWNPPLAGQRRVQLINDIDAALAQARAEERERLKCCVEFVRLILDRWQEMECLIESVDVQECLEESGVLITTKYDPVLHGDQDAEPGDPWHVFSPEYAAIRGRTP